MKDIIIVGGGNFNMAHLAIAMLQLSSREVNELRVILKDEYGVEPVDLKKEINLSIEKTLECMPEILPSPSDVEIFAKSRQKELQKKSWVVPRTIGRPCKGKFQKRK